MSSVQALSKKDLARQASSRPTLAGQSGAISSRSCSASQQPSSYPASWHSICSRNDLVAYSGVVAWFAGAQVALFYLPDETGGRIYAIHNRDPLSGANVIGRGILGRLQESVVVASPLYKQHFRLEDGECLEEPGLALAVWPARLNGGQVEIFADGSSAAGN